MSNNNNRKPRTEERWWQKQWTHKARSTWRWINWPQRSGRNHLVSLHGERTRHGIQTFVSAPICMASWFSSGRSSSSGLGEKLDSCLSPDKPMEGLAGGNKQKSGVEYFAKSLNDRLGHLGWINKGIITQGLWSIKDEGFKEGHKPMQWKEQVKRAVRKEREVLNFWFQR